ncbi:FAD/NAD(P)-binding domain-containing protein [Durotheca rogersii]|uniref:FAD/NAD(P)-binding domain-containing protein n=1 Tax=Durotheca rogersii TaxID=419775 RepID=UPI00221ECAB8|nr:FAD/NAD(P)-binding domain-containing protein [Durotheca rogersii]KAI5863058.1 FAD/NAD(P)-binding domain-containing protein [Durotheca rogersii]
MAFVDVAIIGGGPAGLTAAATIVRQLHTAVVFDNGKYRNAKSSHMHMVPTWDHKDPSAFRNTIKEDILARYSTVRFVDLGVSKIEKKSDAHFRVVDESGNEYDFRKIILAVGTADAFPDIEGYQEAWARRIFHCLFCFGYEDRGAKSTGVLVVPPIDPGMGIYMAGNAAQLSEEVTLYTHGNDEFAAKLTPLAAAAKAKFKVDSRPIKRFVDTGSSLTIEFADGSTNHETFLVHNPKTGVNGSFVEQLGLALSPIGDIQAAGPFFQTSVRGVFAAGDAVNPYKAANAAISSGCNAAVAAIAQLQAEKYGIPALL